MKLPAKLSQQLRTIGKSWVGWPKNGKWRLVWGNSQWQWHDDVALRYSMRPDVRGGEKRNAWLAHLLEKMKEAMQRTGGAIHIHSHIGGMTHVYWRSGLCISSRRRDPLVALVEVYVAILESEKCHSPS